MTHEQSTFSSRNICDLMVSRIEAEIGDISVKHAKSLCSLGKDGKFAYAYHRRDGVLVYLRSQEADGEKLSSLCGKVALGKRRTMGNAWAKISPYYIKIDSSADVSDSIPLLVYVAQIRATRKNSGLCLLPSEAEATDMLEGGRTTVQVNRFERDQAARRRCIQIFGTACSVCGFDFSEIYGDIGAGFIHVHHLTPLSMIGKRYKVNASTDLRPVCPNCHEMLHMKTPPLLIEELKAKISK